ncbi:polymorphic toxin type 15 domain-containing protein [Microbacterium sp. NPDC077644]|uniref:polymorphic toxin type 15 domain-containing protein n=1 Tax=Microbacterium sp. NPDC077644 TaxID=3155055 RepID=UPI00344F505E
MGSVKPIVRELKQAVLKGMGHSKDRLHQLTDNIDNHVGDVVRRVRGTDHFDGSIDVNVRPFRRNRNHDSAEYNRQYNEQMDTLQNMSAADWLRNRIEYLEHGRPADSLRAQQAARDAALADKIAELRAGGMSRSEARDAASTWMQSQAALHRLDGIAGGDVTDISRVGDSRVNSSLGSQWRTRVGDIDRAIIDYVNANPGVDLSTLNINLVFG